MKIGQKGLQYKDKSTSNEKKILRIVTVIVIIIILVMVSISYIDSKEKKSEKTVMMTYEQYKNDMEYSIGYGLRFKSLAPGDVLEIQDEIKYLASAYNEYNQEIVTYIWFNSTHSGESIEYWREYNYWNEIYYYCNYDVTFKGNLTNRFTIGDKVKITLHIIEKEWYGYRIEYFEEIWDTNDVPHYQIFPKSCIEVA